MRFSVGWWDELFGDRVTLEVPNTEGQTIKRQVTKKWLEKMEADGHIKPSQPVVRVHLLGLSGKTVEHWLVGTDIDQETVDEFRDVATGDIYASTHLEKGKPQTFVIKKEEWETLRRKLNSLAEDETQAQFDLGLMYANGEDYAEAVHCLRLAADKGHAIAQELLGLAYSDGPSPRPTLTWNRLEPLLSGHFSDTAPHVCRFFAMRASLHSARASACRHG